MGKGFAVIACLVAAAITSGCSGTRMTTKPVALEGQQEIFDKEKVTVVSVGSASAVAAKWPDLPPAKSSIPLFLGITNLSSEAFNVDHSNVTGTVTPGPITVLPLSVDAAKTYISDEEGPGAARYGLAGLGMVVGVLGALTGNAGAVAQGTSQMKDVSDRASAAEALSKAAQTQYLSKTTVLPGSTTDGLVMLQLIQADGDPIGGASELVDQVIDAQVTIGADVHRFRLTFPMVKN